MGGGRSLRRGSVDGLDQNTLYSCQISQAVFTLKGRHSSCFSHYIMHCEVRTHVCSCEKV